MGVIPFRAKDGTVWMAAWGYVFKDPKVGMTKNGKPKISFKLVTNRDRDGHNTYLNVVCYGATDAATTAACLERKDSVLCLGSWSKRTFEKMDGTIGVWEELAANFLFVQTRPEPVESNKTEPVYELAEFVPPAPTEPDEQDYVPSI